MKLSGRKSKHASKIDEGKKEQNSFEIEQEIAFIYEIRLNEIGTKWFSIISNVQKVSGMSEKEKMKANQQIPSAIQK